MLLGLLWWLRGKELACQCRKCGFNPWVGKAPWRRKWQPTSVFLPGQSHGQRSLASYSPWDKKKKLVLTYRLNNNNCATYTLVNDLYGKWHKFIALIPLSLFSFHDHDLYVPAHLVSLNSPFFPSPALSGCRMFCSASLTLSSFFLLGFLAFPQMIFNKWQMSQGKMQPRMWGTQ